MNEILRATQLASTVFDKQIDSPALTNCTCNDQRHVQMEALYRGYFNVGYTTNPVSPPTIFRFRQVVGMDGNGR
jgi:hypothetical protein